MKAFLLVIGFFLISISRLPAQANALATFPDKLSSEFLISHEFYAQSDLWEMPPAEPDRVRFRKDGRVENKRAGLSGRWKLLDANTVEIGAQRFTLNSERTALFWPIRDGVETGTRIYIQPEKSKDAQPIAPANRQPVPGQR